jgi:hypothetical protein
LETELEKLKTQAAELASDAIGTTEVAEPIAETTKQETNDHGAPESSTPEEE